MKAKTVISILCISLTLSLFVTTKSAQAECCYVFNPLLLPFAVAGTVLGTAAAIVAAPFDPYYYGPAYYGPAYAPAPAYYGPGPYRHRSVWIRGHHNRYGDWVPGHWRDQVWMPGHHDSRGYWVRGHWR